MLITEYFMAGEKSVASAKKTNATTKINMGSILKNLFVLLLIDQSHIFL